MAYTPWSVVNFEQPDVNKWNQLGENDAFLNSSLDEGQVAFDGLTEARTFTLPDANATLARTDAGQTFTGVNTMTAPVFNTSISTPSIITASGALGITPAAGSGLNITLSTTGDFAVNTSQLFIDTSTTYFGFNTATPNGAYTFVQGNLAYDNGAGVRIQSSAAADRTFMFFFTNSTDSTNGIQSYQDGTGAGAKTLHLNKLGGKVVAGAGLEVVGDAGGTASSLGLSNVFNTSISSGTGTVKLAGTTARNSVGWAKFYNGTTAIYIPYWTTITG